MVTKRIVIVGGPKSGKTTLAKSLGPMVRHTDDLIGKADWSEASELVAHWFDIPGNWVVEGVATARALRKWLARKPGGFPAKIVFLEGSRIPLTPGQRAMTKGVLTVWRQILPELTRREAQIEYRYDGFH